MKPRPFDPRHLDVQAFTKEGADLAGEWPLSGFERLRDALHADAPPGPDDLVRWQARGEQRGAGVEPRDWLHLRSEARLALVCQRCLQPVHTDVRVDRRFGFVPGEEAAAALDAELEDDVLALTRALDLHELVEDELLLALPLVPHHDSCPAPPAKSSAGDGEDERPNPFAALAALKSPPRDGTPH